jgi:RNA polymerase sigma-70 factor (ECF subfamily)
MDDRERERDESDRRWRLWMVAAQAGDSATYEKLLLELLPYVRSQLPGRIRDRADREDIVQNVLISLHRARHTYRSEQPFVPWLRAVVRNAAIDWLRAHGRRARHEWSGNVEDAPEPAYEAPARGDEPLSPELEGALAALPSKQREAVELLHVEGLSVAEAAARAGVRPGALKVRAHRGYRALRALLSRRDA